MYVKHVVLYYVEFLDKLGSGQQFMVDTLPCIVSEFLFKIVKKCIKKAVIRPIKLKVQQ